MPPNKFHQPSTLENLASALISNLALDSCLKIQQRFPESEHIVEARKLHQHLLNIQPLLDDVFNRSLSIARTQPLGIRGKVMLSALMHPRLKFIFYPHFVGPENNEHFIWEFDLWITQLKQVPYVVELDITGIKIQLDSILQVVGKSCHNLEIISIDKDSVTSQGLINLVYIQGLRVICTKPSYVISTDPFEKEHVFPNTLSRGIRILVQHLPILEKIPYDCMGQLLVDLQYMPSLSLTECFDHGVNLERLQAMVALCPKLSRLYLVGRGSDFMELNLTPIIESSLKIESVEFCTLNIAETLEGFLLIKGLFITQLKLWDVTIKGTDKILYLIGKNCPRIKFLHLAIEHHKNNNLDNVHPISAKKTIFENLLELHLRVSEARGIHYADLYPWDIMLSCLVNAKKIKFLLFHLPCFSENVAFEGAMSNLLLLNKLSELEKLNITHGTFRSMGLVTDLCNLPKITVLEFFMCRATPEMKNHVEGLIQNIHAKNFNLTFSVSYYNLPAH